MWCDFFNNYGRPCIFGEPTTPDEIRGLDEALGAALPTDLHDILKEANGVSIFPTFFEDIDEEEGAFLQVIWATDEIIEKNIFYRTSNLWTTMGPTHPCDLLFFASTPNGDPISYEMACGHATGPRIIAMSHEDGTQHTISPSLYEYLTSLLEVCK